MEAINHLKQAGFKIAAVEQAENSVNPSELTLNRDEKLCLVFGNEVGGVSQQVVDNADICIEIPQYGTKHSLNISVCAGIVIWECFKKLRQ